MQPDFVSRCFCGALRAVAPCVLLLGTGAISPTATAQTPTSAEQGTVINLSGRQRMLTQKMAKEVLLVGLDIDRAKNLQNLAATAELFDSTLKGLVDGDEKLGLPKTTSKRILKQLGQVRKIWSGFHEALQQILESKKVVPAQLERVAAENLPLLKRMNRCVKLYEKSAKKSGLEADPSLAVTINLAGKQRMLTQKMSKEFLLIASGVEVEDNRLSLLETYTLFDRTLLGLLNGDEVLELPGTKDPAIRKQLEVVRGLWNKFKPVIEFATKDQGQAIPREKIEQLAATNLPLLREMNKAVGLYQTVSATPGK